MQLIALRSIPKIKKFYVEPFVTVTTIPIREKQNNLYQSCVSERLKEMDEMMFNQSPYKPEITYDMHTDPPSPIMDKNILTKGHEYVWGWIKKNWLNDKGYEYEKGQGMSRRPDVVIVKDPNLPNPR